MKQIRIIRNQMENAARFLPGVELCQDAYQVATESDALIVVTEWNEFKQLDKGRLLSLMRQPYLIDGRNIYDREEMERLGFVYWGLGRGMADASAAPRAEPDGAQT